MHKFSIIFAFISSMFTAITYAIDACGIDVKINRNHAVQTVTCAGCRTFTDFAMFGGALLSQTSAISIPVENNRGDRAVVSIQRYISNPTGANISTDLLRRFGLQINLPDPDRSGITVDTVKGYVFGSRWDTRRTLDRSLEAKCKEIEKQKKEESAPARSNRGAGYGNAVSGSPRWLSPWSIRDRRRGIVTTYSCTGSCGSGGGGSKPIPSGDAKDEE